MDVVAHNVVRFELPSFEESAPPALIEEVQTLYNDGIPRKGEADNDLPVPPCICEGEVLNFPACNLDNRVALLTEARDSSTAQKAGVTYEQFSGSLFLIGGHADDTFNELLKLAPKNPKVVVVGRASGLQGADESLAEDFFKAGVKLDDITIVIPTGYTPTDTRFKHTYEVPADADVVYFGGGAQDKLRREFDDHQLGQVKELLKKGALVGGSSAGAAVMSEEMINGGDERKLETAHGFGLTPWAILDTHVGQRHREARDVKALYEIGDGKRPVIGLDEDTRVRFFWSGGKLLGEIGGQGLAKVFQTPEMPQLIVNRNMMSKVLTDGADREAHVWELKEGDIFEIRIPMPVQLPPENGTPMDLAS